MKTFTEALAARGITKVPRYRRSFTAPRTDYIWPETKRASRWTLGFTQDETREAIGKLRIAAATDNVKEYVAIWSHINHLKEC